MNLPKIARNTVAAAAFTLSGIMCAANAQMAIQAYISNERMPIGQLYVLRKGMVVRLWRFLGPNSVWGEDMLLESISLICHAQAVALTYVEVFTLNQGLRVVDPSVVARGFVAVPGKPMRLLVQGVGRRFDHHFDRRWRDGEAPRTQLVFIGEDLDEAALREAAQTVAPPGSTLAAGALRMYTHRRFAMRAAVSPGSATSTSVGSRR